VVLDEVTMNAQEFVTLSTKLFTDMKAWIAEASRDDTLSKSDLAMLEAATRIVEHVTLQEATLKPGSTT
jgi:hypothetical protein